MRKVLTIFLVALLTLSIFSALTPKVKSSAIRVPQDYLTVQAAINAATSGDIILVSSGTYREGLILNKTVSIIGENRLNTFIEGKGMEGVAVVGVVTVVANGTFVSGFTIRNVEMPGYLASGILLDNSYGNTISGNILSGNGDGIYLNYSSNNVISANTVEDNFGVGIHLRHSPNNVFRNNDLIRNRANFGFDVYGFSSIEDYAQDIDASNTIDGKPMYHWIDQRNRQVPTDAGYIALINSVNITVRDVVLPQPMDFSQGIILLNVTNSVLQNITVWGSPYSLPGIFLQNSKNNLVNNSVIFGGIELRDSDDNDIRNNRIWGQWKVPQQSGIRLWESNNNVIVANFITRHTNGIQSDNYSHDNVFYYNNFNKNEKHANEIGAYSRWDDSEEKGNFWSDYTGTDANADGIGDTPYIIDEKNKDNFPLMKSIDSTPPTMVHDYDGKWHTAYFNLTLKARDDLSGVAMINHELTYVMPRTNVSAHPGEDISHIYRRGLGAEKKIYANFETANGTLEYWSEDFAGNIEGHALTGIKVDTTPPSKGISIISWKGVEYFERTGSLLEKYSNYTDSPYVGLRLRADDYWVSGMSQMRFSNDGITWTPWEDYIEYDGSVAFKFRNWTLSQGDGLKAVYVEYKDNAGLISSASDTIILDTTPPLISIISPANGSETRSTSQMITWTSTDATSGIDYCEISLDGRPFVRVGNETTYTFAGLADGVHTVEVISHDKAENLQKISISFAVNTSPIGGPGNVEEFGVLAIAIVALLGITACYFRIRKRNKRDGEFN